MAARTAFNHDSPSQDNQQSKSASGLFTLDMPIQGGGSKCAYSYGYLYALLADREIYLRRLSTTSGSALGGAVIASTINAYHDYDSGRAAAMNQLIKLKDNTAYESDAFFKFLRNRAALRGIDWAPDDPNIPTKILDEIETYIRWRDTFRDTFNYMSSINNASMVNCVMFPPMAGWLMLAKSSVAPVEAALNSIRLHKSLIIVSRILKP